MTKQDRINHKHTDSEVFSDNESAREQLMFDTKDRVVIQIIIEKVFELKSNKKLLSAPGRMRLEVGLDDQERSIKEKIEEKFADRDDSFKELVFLYVTAELGREDVKSSAENRRGFNKIRALGVEIRSGRMSEKEVFGHAESEGGFLKPIPRVGIRQPSLEKRSRPSNIPSTPSEPPSADI